MIVVNGKKPETPQPKVNIKSGGERMKYRFPDGEIATKEERIEHLKKLSKDLREQLFEKPKTLLPDEVEYFISIFKAELEHLYKD